MPAVTGKLMGTLTLDNSNSAGTSNVLIIVRQSCAVATTEHSGAGY